MFIYDITFVDKEKDLQLFSELDEDAKPKGEKIIMEKSQRTGIPSTCCESGQKDQVNRK